MLSADHITVSYDEPSGENVLDGVSLDIRLGAITAIVGPNGSGKSTLVKALSRVLKPSHGAVLMNGKDLYRAVSARVSAQSIGVAPQDTHVAFDFNSRELVSMGLAPHRSGLELFSGESILERSAIDRALLQAKISDEQALRPVMTLSGGERQRVLIARAMVQDAAVILLDEPSSSLDLAHQAILFDQLRNLALNENKAIMVVLHDLNQASALADRIVLMKMGKIVANGSSEEVLTRQNIFSAYGCDVVLTKDISTGAHMIAVPTTNPRARILDQSLFVICGGGGGVDLLRSLHAAGATIDAGRLHYGDVDQLVADTLGIKHTPFSAFHTLPDMTRLELDNVRTNNQYALFTPGGVSSLNFAQINCACRLAEDGMVVLATNQLQKQIATESQSSSSLESAWNKLKTRLGAPPFEDSTSLMEYLMRSADA